MNEAPKVVLAFVDPRRPRYRTVEDYELDVLDGTMHRAVQPLRLRLGGAPEVNPEWLSAPLEVVVIWSDTVLTVPTAS